MRQKIDLRIMKKKNYWRFMLLELKGVNKNRIKNNEVILVQMRAVE